jgi:tetratricopeptide (TPR) repeat protein
MAQPVVNAKIEELQFRIKTDPKSRLFLPLAEELRKNARLAEAEQVLRTGLGVHASYLSAWVSLGRVLREQNKNTEAVGALNTALQVDPGNVVAARLLADVYLDLGQKLEAIKKYKLVHALMPSDEELEAKIEELDQELNPVVLMPLAAPHAEPEAPFAETEPDVQPQRDEPSNAAVFNEPETPAATADLPFAAGHEAVFDETTPVTRTVEKPFDTDDDVPMAAQHAESPFEEPSAYSAESLAIEQPAGIHIEEAPPGAEVASVWADDPAGADSTIQPDAGTDAVDSDARPQDDDLTATTTMADLYVRQGLTEDARKIYEHLLQRDPSNDEVRGKLEALTREDHSPDALTESAEEQPVEAVGSGHSKETAPPAKASVPPNHGKVVVLEQWLAKVARREPGGA